MGEGEKRVKHEWKNFYVGKNPDTGRPYFERRKVVVRDPNEPPEEPPDMDTLPPVEELPGFTSTLKTSKNIGIQDWQKRKDIKALDS